MPEMRTRGVLVCYTLYFQGRGSLMLMMEERRDAVLLVHQDIFALASIRTAMEL